MPMFAQTGSESGTADTGGSLSHSTSSLDRDEPLHQQQQVCIFFAAFKIISLNIEFACMFFYFNILENVYMTRVNCECLRVNKHITVYVRDLIMKT